MAPRGGEKTEKAEDEQDRERTRSPRADTAKQEKYKEPEQVAVQQEKEEKEGEDKGKKRAKGDSGQLDKTQAETHEAGWWTEQEWAKWKKEQAEWRSRMETSTARSSEQFEDLRAGHQYFKAEQKEWNNAMEAATARSSTQVEELAKQDQQRQELRNIETQNIHKAVMENNSELKAMGGDMMKQRRDLDDVREATSVLIQWNKNGQKDEADRQIKLLGWNGEDRHQRRATVERWLNIVGGWDDYFTVRTLNAANSKGKGKGKGKLLTFSLLEAKTREGREELLYKLKNSKMYGLFGTEIWGKRNVAKHMREGGHLFRYFMRVLENVRPNTRFEYIDWVNEGVKLDGCWVGAIVQADEAGKLKTLCISEDHYDMTKVEQEAARLWETYLGYDKKSSVSSSSTSLMTSLNSPDLKVYYVQDHHEYNIAPLREGLADSLEIAKAEKEEAEERRRMPRQRYIEEEEEEDDDDMNGINSQQKKWNWKQAQPPAAPPPPAAAAAATPPAQATPKQQHPITYAGSSSDTSDGEGVTSAQAVGNAKGGLLDMLRKEKKERKKMKNPWANMAVDEERMQMEQEAEARDAAHPPKEGTSAWAIRNAKNATKNKKEVNWGDWLEEQQQQPRQQQAAADNYVTGYVDGYVDQWGLEHPYTSEDYKADPGKYDWNEVKGAGKKGGKKKRGGKGKDWWNQTWDANSWDDGNYWGDSRWEAWR